MYISDNPTVLAKNVKRTYRADNKRTIFRNPLASSNQKVDRYVHALKGVNFVAEQGESIGVLGRNGSGKSTLMRLIAGKEAPTDGQIFVSSAPTLLNVSAALQPRLSGLENIRLGLLAQGLSPKDIPPLSEDIQDFADIGDAVKRPMNTYSSGMGARLKFAISTSVQREVLLIDEALATGDAAFTKKAQDRMSGFLSDSGTIFLVSHAMATIKNICSRAIWLNDGEIIADGPAPEVTQLYNKWTMRIGKGDKQWADDLLNEVRAAYKPPHIITVEETNEYFNSK
ncbi:ABC transporter ATP-binding protein [Corynebacteriaceae bacterium 6-324]